MECKKTLSEFVHMYVYVCMHTQMHMHKFRHKCREARCQSSLSTWRESLLLFTTVHTGGYTPLSAQGSLCLQVQEHWIQRYINAPGFTPVWRIRIQVLTIARQLLYLGAASPGPGRAYFVTEYLCWIQKQLCRFDFYCSPLSSEQTRKGHLIKK